jgi:hypothetical protein
VGDFGSPPGQIITTLPPDTGLDAAENGLNNAVEQGVNGIIAAQKQVGDSVVKSVSGVSQAVKKGEQVAETVVSGAKQVGQQLSQFDLTLTSTTTTAVSSSSASASSSFPTSSTPMVWQIIVGCLACCCCVALTFGLYRLFCKPKKRKRGSMTYDDSEDEDEAAWVHEPQVQYIKRVVQLDPITHEPVQIVAEQPMGSEEVRMAGLE